MSDRQSSSLFCIKNATFAGARRSQGALPSGGRHFVSMAISVSDRSAVLTCSGVSVGTESRPSAVPDRRYKRNLGQARTLALPRVGALPRGRLLSRLSVTACRSTLSCSERGFGPLCAGLVRSTVIDAPPQREMSLTLQRNDTRAVPATIRPRVFLKMPTALAKTAGNFPE